MKLLLSTMYHILLYFGSIAFVIVAIPCALLARYTTGKANKKPRLVWGSTPIINNSYWSRAMVAAGYRSDTFTSDYFSSINKRSDWDHILSERYKLAPRLVKPFIAVIHALFLYDIFFIPFTSFFLGASPSRFFQAQIFKIARKKIVVIPFGADSYVYRRIRSTETLHGLMASYPLEATKQAKIARDTEYWTKHADAILLGFMGPDGFGRWDVLVPSLLFIDLEMWGASKKMSTANGSNESVIIVHTPNHRGFKGSEFVLDGVRKLQSEGLKVELKLLEKVQNTEVRRILCEEADILVEQLIFTGHGLSGLEGMAAGLPTISNLEDAAYITPLRRWSYFGECPLVSATPENIVDVLRKLITRPELRHQLGRASRSYVEKYHGLDSAQYLFTNVIDYLYGKRKSIINLYHPLLSEYTNRSPKVVSPLINNRIED